MSNDFCFLFFMKRPNLHRPEQRFRLFSTFFFLLGFLFFAPNLNAQENPLSHNEIIDSAFVRAVNQYDKAIGRNAMLFTGQEYYSRQIGVKGDQFYTEDYWEVGTVEFRGQVYDSIYLKYDTYSDQLLVEHFSSSGTMASLQLYKPDVNGFYLFGHKFIQIKKDSLSNIKGGFYDELVIGSRAQLLAKRNKEIVADHSVNSYLKEYRVKDTYIIKKGEDYYAVRNKQAALKVFADNRKELKKFIKANNLFLLKEKERSFIEMVRFYNSIAV